MLMYIKFGNQSQNCQTTKLKSPPNVLRIQYVIVLREIKGAIYLFSSQHTAAAGNTCVLH